MFPTLDTVQRAIRARVCASCPRRSLGWENAGPVTRLCESACPLFTKLPKVFNAARLTDPMLGSPHRAMLRQFEADRQCDAGRCKACQDCVSNETVDPAQRRIVIQTIEQLVDA